MSPPSSRNFAKKAARVLALATAVGVKSSTFSLGKLSNIKCDAKAQTPSGSSATSERNFGMYIPPLRSPREGDLFLGEDSGVAMGIQRMENRGVVHHESPSSASVFSAAPHSSTAASGNCVERDEL
jgi:hypothetical protein